MAMCLCMLISMPTAVTGLFETRYDQCFFTPGALQCTAVREVCFIAGLCHCSYVRGVGGTQGSLKGPVCLKCAVSHLVYICVHWQVIDPSQRERVIDEGLTLPNSWHPSDHLPIAARFVCIL